MGASQSVDIPGGGTEGYHVLRVRAGRRTGQLARGGQRGSCCAVATGAICLPKDLHGGLLRSEPHVAA
uniref:Uncharacterized protein n=1 Tax=Gopherus agassizii TaxID=38772 RepID=A0A452IDI0_9SAUR